MLSGKEQLSQLVGAGAHRVAEEFLRTVIEANVVVVFVTGWSSGIGFETCVLLLLSDFPKRKVEIHVPTRGFGGKGRKGGGFERESEDDETKTVERMRRVARERGAVLNETKKIVLAKIDVDLATLAVDARARKRTRRYFATERVDVLIHCAAECNAERKVVLVEEGGVDRVAMCNVLGPAVLTKLWREEIRKDDKRKKRWCLSGRLRIERDWEYAREQTRESG